MVNCKKKVWKMAVGGILFGLLISAWSWQYPLNVQCAQSKRNQTQEAENIIKNTIQKLEKAESMHVKATMNMEVDALGMNLDTQAEIDMISFQSPYKIKSESSLDRGFLGEKEWTVYAAQQKGEYQLYEKNGKKWSVNEAQAKELLKYDGRNLLKIYLYQIEELQELGEQTLDGIKTVKYRGAFSGDGQKKVLLDAGSIELVSKLFQNSLIKPFGSLVEQKEKVSAMMESAEDLEVVLWIDKYTGYPVQCKMELTEMLSAAYKELAESMSSETARKIARKIEIKKTEIIIECDDFNDAEEIELP